ncbi:MAG: hypothetical protein ACPLPW_00800, partial [bacterium]
AVFFILGNWFLGASWTIFLTDKMKAPVRSNILDCTEWSKKEVHRMLYAGIDHHTQTTHLTLIDEEGRVIKQKEIPSERKALKEALAGYSEPIKATLEASYNCEKWGTVPIFCRGPERRRDVDYRVRKEHSGLRIIPVFWKRKRKTGLFE